MFPLKTLLWVFQWSKALRTEIDQCHVKKLNVANTDCNIQLKSVIHTSQFFYNHSISVKECVCAHLLSRVQLFVTLWTIPCQAPLSMGFSRQKYWSGLPCPLPGDLPDSGIKPMSLKSPALASGFFFYQHHLGNPKRYIGSIVFKNFIGCIVDLQCCVSFRCTAK